MIKTSNELSCAQQTIALREKVHTSAAMTYVTRQGVGKK